jgi:hypothetical protein
VLKQSINQGFIAAYRLTPLFSGEVVVAQLLRLLQKM